ncbi:MAG TPA: VCBS repeat-containing protein [Thermoanaerobaculia bacterium]|nr:VCBS repeat-containing protein [Thermoanaerobaculia bacterium]
MRTWPFVFAVILAVSALADTPCSFRTLRAARPTLISGNDLVFGDLNHDGRPDIVDMKPDNLTVLLNRGNDVYSATEYGTDGYFPPLHSVATADLNGDGNLDLIGSNGGQLRVALGRGDGTLQAPFWAFQNFRSLDERHAMLADFDGDGRLDYAIYAYDSPSALLFYGGNADGTFRLRGSYPLSVRPFYSWDPFIAADFDGDGRIDFVLVPPPTVGLPGSSIVIYWNRGNFQFDSQSLDIPKISSPRLAVAQHKNDRASTLFILGSEGIVTVDATARSPIVKFAYTGDLSGFNLAGVGDVDADGNTDIVVYKTTPTEGSDYPASIVGVMWGASDGAFQQPALFSLPGIRTARVIDADGDGLPDIVASGTEFYILHSPVTNRRFPAAPLDAAMSSGSFVVADMDGHGFRDVVASYAQPTDGSPQPKGFQILSADAMGEFSKRAALADLTGKPVVADFDGDGQNDIAGLIGSQLVVLFGKGSMRFSDPVSVIDGVSTAVLAQLDNSPVIFTEQDNLVKAIKIRPDRSIDLMTVFSSAAVPFTAADLDRDGTSEIITFGRNADAIRVLKRSSDGSYRESSKIVTQNTARVAVIDINGDGLPDILTWDGGLEVFINQGATFRPVINTFTAVPFIVSVSAFDFDGDGITDLALSAATGYASAGALAVLRGVGGGAFELTMTIPLSSLPAEGGVFFNDFDQELFKSLIVPTSLGFETLQNVCDDKRLRVALDPANPTEGASLSLLIFAEAPGTVTVTDALKQVVTGAVKPDKFGIVTQNLPYTAAGTHIFRITYINAGTTRETVLTVNVRPAGSRVRSVHH